MDAVRPLRDASIDSLSSSSEDQPSCLGTTPRRIAKLIRSPLDHVYFKKGRQADLPETGDASQEKSDESSQQTRQTGPEFNSEKSPLLPASAGATKAGADEYDGYRLVIDLILCTVVMLLFFLVVNKLCGRKLELYSEELMQTLGLKGLFLIAFVLEFAPFPMPVPYMGVIYMALFGGFDARYVLATCAAGSYLAAVAGYWAGRALRNWCPLVLERFDNVKSRYPQAERLLEERGAAGVASAMLLPVPLFLVSWVAGSLAIPAFCYCVAAVSRCVKVSLGIGLYVAVHNAAFANGSETSAFAKIMRSVSH